MQLERRDCDYLINKHTDATNDIDHEETLRNFQKTLEEEGENIAKGNAYPAQQ